MELAYSPASLEFARPGFKRGRRRPVGVPAGIGEAAELDVQFPTLVKTGIPEDLRPTYHPSPGSVLNSKEDTGTFTAESRRP